MRKSIRWSLACLLVVAGIFGCGGGGSDGARTTPLGTTVDLSEIRKFAEAKAPGSAMSFNLTGEISSGANLTGTFSRLISTPTDTATPTGFKTVNVLRQNATITNKSTGAFASAQTTYYYYQTGYLIKIENDAGTISTPLSQTLLPSSAKVGDFGADMVVSISDGSSETRTWRIDPGVNGDAQFVYVYSDKDGSNTVTATSEDAYTIKPDGTIASITTKIYYPASQISITLSGNKI